MALASLWQGAADKTLNEIVKANRSISAEQIQRDPRLSPYIGEAAEKPATFLRAVWVGFDLTLQRFWWLRDLGACSLN